MLNIGQVSKIKDIRQGIISKLILMLISNHPQDHLEVIWILLFEDLNQFPVPISVSQGAHGQVIINIIAFR